MSKTCPTCGARIEQSTAYPKARLLAIQYAKRDLYVIDGKAGLWFKAEVQTDTCYAVTEFGTWCFYRAAKAEKEIRQALGIEGVKP